MDLKSGIAPDFFLKVKRKYGGNGKQVGVVVIQVNC